MSRPESDPEDPSQLSSLDALLSLGTPEPDPASAGALPPPTPAVGPVGELREIDIDWVVPNEFQPRRRFDEESLAALTESVRELGVLQPILVRPGPDGVYELIAGERRWRAARRAGLTTITAVVRTTDDVSSLEQAIVENLHRQDLNALEEAAAYQQLVDDFGFTQDEVAARVGKSRSAISNTLRLFQLPASVQRLVGGGELSAGHARAILSVADPGAQKLLATRIVDEDLSVRDAEEAAKLLDSGTQDRSRGAERAQKGRSKSASALEVERLLGDRLDTKVDVVESAGSGRVVIRFADKDDLERIYRLLAD